MAHAPLAEVVHSAAEVYHTPTAAFRQVTTAASCISIVCTEYQLRNLGNSHAPVTALALVEAQHGGQEFLAKVHRQSSCAAGCHRPFLLHSLDCSIPIPPPLCRHPDLLPYPQAHR